jgi:hypothetical protein
MGGLLLGKQDLHFPVQGEVHWALVALLLDPRDLGQMELWRPAAGCSDREEQVVLGMQQPLSLWPHQQPQLPLLGHLAQELGPSQGQQHAVGAGAAAWHWQGRGAEVEVEVQQGLELLQAQEW